MSHRTLQTIIPSHASSDGDGVKIRRVALFDTTVTDPFLMLDELGSDNPDDYIGGFPPHPHRGMETLTYLRFGALEHRDHLGNRGEIRSGGAQWMSAGRGIIHSEMPSREMSRLHGFQLWINLPAKHKMDAPKYRDVPADEITECTLNTGINAKALAGNWQLNGQELQGPLQDLAAQARYLDLYLPAGLEVTIPIDAGHNTLAYVYEGQLETSPAAPEKSLLVFNQTGDTLLLQAKSNTQLLLLTGKAIKEPVAHYGPFVMNTREEIEQAIQDYNNGLFGN